MYGIGKYSNHSVFGEATKYLCDHMHACMCVKMDRLVYPIGGVILLALLYNLGVNSLKHFKFQVYV